MFLHTWVTSLPALVEPPHAAGIMRDPDALRAALLPAKQRSRLDIQLAQQLQKIPPAQPAKGNQQSLNGGILGERGKCPAPGCADFAGGENDLPQLVCLGSSGERRRLDLHQPVQCCVPCLFGGVPQHPGAAPGIDGAQADDNGQADRRMPIVVGAHDNRVHVAAGQDFTEVGVRLDGAAAVELVQPGGSAG